MIDEDESEIDRLSKVLWQTTHLHRILLDVPHLVNTVRCGTEHGYHVGRPVLRRTLRQRISEVRNELHEDL